MEPAVIITPHAEERAYLRCPDLRAGGTAGIRREVIEALGDGRHSRRRPRWLAIKQSRKLKTDAEPGQLAFVWPQGRQRAYLVSEKLRPDGEGHPAVVVVVTVIVPNRRRSRLIA